MGLLINDRLFLKKNPTLNKKLENPPLKILLINAS